MTLDAGPDALYTTLARAADAPAVAQLVNLAYRGAASRRGWTSEADLLDGERIDAPTVAALIAAPGSAILVVRGQKGLNAAAHVWRESPATAGLGLLAVRPTLQGSLLGRHMLAAAERYALRELGAHALELTVIDRREELIAWYERRGYVLSGERRPFPADGSEGGVPARAALVLLVMRRELAA
jgi:GNAT superfamily N-acetyltransferase